MKSGPVVVGVISGRADLTPSEAAQLLGVSRQFVDRLISHGKLSFVRLPGGSSHRRIPVAEVARFQAEREQRREAHRTAVAALDAAQVPWEDE